MNTVQTILLPSLLTGLLWQTCPTNHAQGAPAAPASAPSVAQAFGQAFAEHESAVATAHATESRRYQTALNALAARAQRSGDADALAAAKGTLAALATQPAPPLAATLAAMGPYVGGWDCLTSWGYHYSVILQGDGSLYRAGKRQGTWEVDTTQLTLRGLDWCDVYNLPGQSGVLKGHTADGAHNDFLLTRRGMSMAASLEAGLVGDWDWSMSDGSGDRLVFTLVPGGAMSDSRQLAGSWAVVDGKELVLTFDAHQDWKDVYELPMGPNGVINGHNPFGGKFMLTRKGRATGAASVAGTTSRGGGASGTVRAGSDGAAGGYFGTKRPVGDSAPAPTPHR